MRAAVFSLGALLALLSAGAQAQLFETERMLTKPVEPGQDDGRRAAKGDQGARLQILAAFDRVDARGVGHVGVDHFADGEGGQRLGQVHLLADHALQRRTGRGRVQLHPAAGEAVGIDAAQHHVGVGHGRLGAAEAIAGGPGLGRRAFRTDANAANLLTSDIDERDREFSTGERTAEGFYRVRNGLDQAISRGLSYAPFAIFSIASPLLAIAFAYLGIRMVRGQPAPAPTTRSA